MRKLFVFIGTILLFLASTQERAVAGPSAAVQCDSYKMDLKGTTVTFGVSYTELVVLEKVNKSGSVQGKWKLTSFEQIIVYPQSLNFPMDQVDHHDMGHGMWMDVRSVVAGNTVHTQVI